MRKRKIVILVLLSGLLVASGCGSSAENEVVQARPRAVRVEKIEQSDLPVLVRSVGRLVPDREVVVSAQVTGILMLFNADVGTKVDSGDTLVKLDDTDYKLAMHEADAQLQSARARLTAAKNAYNRALKLLPQKVITNEMFDNIEAEYLTSQALVSQTMALADITRQRLKKTKILAPFDGYVTQRFVELGQNVGIGDHVMGIADMATMRVIIHINEHDYVQLDKDDPVTVMIEAFPDTPFSGRVDKIGIKADARTNTFQVEILVDNPNFILKSGLTARVSIRTEIIQDVMMIAQESVLFREDRKEVFVVEDGNKAAARVVELGRIDGSAVQVLNGLSPGDNLVVSGGQYLKSGDEVIVTP